MTIRRYRRKSASFRCRQVKSRGCDGEIRRTLRRERRWLGDVASKRWKPHSIGTDWRRINRLRGENLSRRNPVGSNNSAEPRSPRKQGKGSQSSGSFQSTSRGRSTAALHRGLCPAANHPNRTGSRNRRSWLVRERRWLGGSSASNGNRTASGQIGEESTG